MGQDSQNEVWFRWKVTWQEIDHVLVADNLFSDCKMMIEQAKQDGLIPETVKVSAFPETKPSENQERFEVPPLLKKILEDLSKQQACL